MESTAMLVLLLAVAALLAGVLIAAMIWSSPPMMRRRGFEADGITPLPNLAGKLAILSQIGRQATKLANEVDQEVAAQVARATQAVTDQRDAEALAGLKESERAAVAAVVRSEIEGESRRSRASQRWANALYFVAGVIASVIVTLFVRPL